MGEQAKVSIVVDSREPADVERHLKGFAEVTRAALACGDYVLSERVAVERKAVPDFLSSLRDQRLFTQLRQLLESYERPVLVIEGNQELLLNGSGFPANAIRGALSAIAVDYRIPILWTGDSRETALQLYWIANREQVGGKSSIALRPEKPRTQALSAWQEFLVAGLPGISTVRARKLLEHFKSPADLFLATESELAGVEGIGPKTAEAVFQVLHAWYGDATKRKTAMQRPRSKAKEL